MKIVYDPEHDVMNIEFLPEESIVESIELDGIIIDYAKDAKIVVLEILDAEKRTVQDPLRALDLTIVRERTSR